MPEGLDSALRWEELENLACIPSQSGMLVRIRHRQTVVVLPGEAEQICKSIPDELQMPPDPPNQMSHAPASVWTLSMLRVKHLPKRTDCSEPLSKIDHIAYPDPDSCNASDGLLPFP